MNGEAGCTVCSQARLLKAIFPVAKGYELKLYECASCGSDLWLVARVSRSSVPKRQKRKISSRYAAQTLDAVLRGAARAAANPKTERAANVSRRSRETTSYERDFMLSRIRSLVFKIKKRTPSQRFR